MTQKIIVDVPPIYSEIASAFNLHLGQGIIFSWGRNRIYNPDGVDIPPALIAHEAVHGERQGSGQKIIDWWTRYLEDRRFRLAEELLAHQVEYEYILKNGKRYERRSALQVTAIRLAAPLYGSLITKSEAVAVLRAKERAGYL